MVNENRNEFIIIWKIVNFSLWFHDPDDACISSLKCTAENLDKSIFYVELRKAGWDLACVLFSDGNAAGDGPLPIECTIEIIDEVGETLLSKTFTQSQVISHQYQWEFFPYCFKPYKRNITEDILTFRCRILGEVQTRQPKIECEAMTKIPVDHCSFLWNVKKPCTSDWSENKHFFFQDQTPVKVILSMFKDDVDIKIKRKTSPPLLVTCRMSLIDISGNERFSEKDTYSFSSQYVRTWNFPSFFTKTILEDKKNSLLSPCSVDEVPQDTFSLGCNFFVRNGKNINEVRYRTLPLINTSCMENAVSSLLDDWRNMFASKKHTDVRLRVDNEIFPAHKSILAARSPVFSAMFDQDMLESRTGIVDIDDMDVKTMNSFLEFLYIGVVDDLDYEIASELLTVAEKYQVLSLKEKCASFLISILSEKNVLDIISLSDMVEHELLKASSSNFIKLHAESILRSPQWLKWLENNSKLATEIFCVIATDMASGK